jgi:NADH-quinone oxidoreductase subunit M
MNIIGIDILSFLVIAPALVALALLFVPNKWIARVVALVGAAFIGGVAAAVFFAYNSAAPGYQLVIQVPWFTLLGSSWHVGIDGVSAAMILLTGILTPLAVLVSWEVDDRANIHLALLLFFETGLMGVFVVLDLMQFFLFYELSLVPMYFIINQWGGPNRKYASTKFRPCHWLARLHRRGGHVPRHPDRHGQDAGLSRLLRRFLHQGAGLAIPHLAA